MFTVSGHVLKVCKKIGIGLEPGVDKLHVCVDLKSGEKMDLFENVGGK